MGGSAERFRNLFQEAPFAIAVAALDGGDILFQNDLSSSFCADKRSYLDALFSLQQESEKRAMLQSVREGGTWRRVMQVPVNVSAPSAAGLEEARRSADVILDEIFGEDSVGSVTATAVTAAQGAPGNHGDLLDSNLLSFRIGTSRMQSLAGFDCYATDLGGQFRRQRTQTEFGRAPSSGLLPQPCLGLDIIQSAMCSLPDKMSDSHLCRPATYATSALLSSCSDPAVMNAVAEMAARLPSNGSSHNRTHSLISGLHNGEGPLSYKSSGSSSLRGDFPLSAQSLERDSTRARSGLVPPFDATPEDVSVRLPLTPFCTHASGHDDNPPPAAPPEQHAKTSVQTTEMADSGGIVNLQMGQKSAEKGCTVTAWHDVTAKPFFDPVTGRSAIMLTQSDVTDRVAAENVLTGLFEGQLSTLSGIFPRHVIEHISFCSLNYSSSSIAGGGSGTAAAAGALELMQKQSLQHTHTNVTIMFMDIVGFTSMSKQVEPQAVMAFLNRLFTVFDKLLDAFGVQKVETAGDCYIAACGILSKEEGGFSTIGEEHDAGDSAHRVMEFAKSILEASKQIMMPHDGQPVQIRIGMHTGPCVTGLIGFKLPKFSIFGDTMNTASRMESTSTPGSIQASEATWDLLQDTERWRPTGGVEVKGKGLLKTFIWDGELCLEAAGGATDPVYSPSGLGKRVPPRPADEAGSSIQLPSPTAGDQDRSTPLPMLTAGAAAGSAAMMATHGVVAASHSHCLLTCVPARPCNSGSRSRLVLLGRRGGESIAAEGATTAASAPLFFCDTMVAHDGDLSGSLSRIALPPGIGSVSGSAALLASITLASRVRSLCGDASDPNEQQPSFDVGGWPMYRHGQGGGH